MMGMGTFGRSKKGYVYYTQEPMWMMEGKCVVKNGDVMETHEYVTPRKKGKIRAFGWVKFKKPIELVDAFMNSLVPVLNEEYF